MPTLSIILITKNESGNIIPCLDSVHFADEWIVVDSGSSDDTVEQAQKWGATVFSYPDWQGFGIQKNRALSHATGEWVLSLDADERVTPELAQEIQAAINKTANAAPAAPQPVGYTIPRLSSYCGHFMRHGGWWPDRVLRLFRRQSGVFSDRVVHESVEVTGPVEQLKNHFLHYTYPNLESFIDKMNAYSTAGAKTMHSQGRSASVLQALLHGFWAFLRSYFFRAGFLDGVYGLMLAISTAEYTYYRYIKRWLMEQPTQKIK